MFIIILYLRFYGYISVDLVKGGRGGEGNTVCL